MWAQGGVVDDRESDLLALGASPDQISSVELRAVENTCQVWEENWEALMMFLKMQTQWHVGMAGLIGLNYQSLESLIRLYDVKEPVILFEKVQVIERAALAKLNSKKAK